MKFDQCANSQHYSNADYRSPRVTDFRQIKMFKVNLTVIAGCQVEHIIVKPQLETAFIRLFPGAVIKGQKVGAIFYTV